MKTEQHLARKRKEMRTAGWGAVCTQAPSKRDGRDLQDLVGAGRVRMRRVIARAKDPGEVKETRRRREDTVSYKDA